VSWLPCVRKFPAGTDLAHAVFQCASSAMSQAYFARGCHRWRVVGFFWSGRSRTHRGVVRARDSVYEAGELACEMRAALMNLWTTPIFSAVVIHRCRIG
jgi:hypothetical protein